MSAAMSLGGVRAAVLEQGYFELPPSLPTSLIARARADVERVTAAGAPGVAAFLFDPMWEILDAIQPIARAALGGAEVVILPAFWAWQIGPGAQGWPPHRDRPNRARDAGGDLAAVTIWVALSDATTRNGCMLVVPSYWDYEYENPYSHNVISNEQFLRAVPAPAGGILGWSHALLHWGGACAPGAPPRVSTSFELMRADLVSALPAGERWYPAGWRPELDERVAIVDAQVAQYTHMHDTDADQRAAIAALVAEARAAVR